METEASIQGTGSAASPTLGLTTKVVKGSVWTLIGQVAPLAVSFCATPFVIRLLGSERYGVLVLVMLIPTYFAFADLGMQIASTKFGSEAYAKHDRRSEAAVVHTAAITGLLAIIPVAAVLFFFSALIVSFFNVPASQSEVASISLKVCSVWFIATFLGGVYNTPQLSRLRMDLNSIVNALPKMLGLAAVPIVLYFGFGVIGAVTVNAIVAFTVLVSHLMVSSRLLPELGSFSIDRSKIGILFKYGVAFAVSSVAALLLGSVEKFGLARITSVTELAYYSIAFNLATMLTMFSASMVQSLLPAFSQLQSSESKTALETLYSRGIRLSFSAFIPILVGVALIARSFLTIWAGPDFAENSTGPFYILLGGLVFNVVAYFPSTAIIASGRTDLLAKLYWLELLLYVILALFLIKEFGAVGAAAAWSIRVAVDALLLFFIAGRHCGTNYQHYSTGPHAVAVLVMLVPFLLLVVLSELNAIVIVTSALCLLTYGVIIWWAVLRSDEKSWVRELINGYITNQA